MAVPCCVILPAGRNRFVFKYIQGTTNINEKYDIIFHETASDERLLGPCVDNEKDIGPP